MDEDFIIVEGQRYTLYCPWGRVLRTTAVEIVRIEPGDEYLHAQVENSVGDELCIDSLDYRIDGARIYLYDVNVHFTRRHHQPGFDPYKGSKEL